jgi:hypothetical protein
VEQAVVVAGAETPREPVGRGEGVQGIVQTGQCPAVGVGAPRPAAEGLDHGGAVQTVHHHVGLGGLVDARYAVAVIGEVCHEPCLLAGRAAVSVAPKHPGAVQGVDVGITARSDQLHGGARYPGSRGWWNPGGSEWGFRPGRGGGRPEAPAQRPDL